MTCMKKLFQRVFSMIIHIINFISIENSYIEYSVSVYIKTATLGQYIEGGNSTGFSNSGFHDVAGEHNHRNEGYTAYKLSFTNFTSPSTDKVFAGTARLEGCSAKGGLLNKQLHQESGQQRKIKRFFLFDSA